MKKRNLKLRTNPGSRKCHCIIKIQTTGLAQKKAKTANTWFQTAHAKYLQGDLTAAVLNYEYGLKINPANVEAQNWLSEVFIFACEFENAITQLTHAIQINPFFLNSHLTRGMAYLGLGKYDEAIDDFSFVIKYFPDCVGAFIGRGDSKYMKNDFKGALDDYSYAAKIDPSARDRINNIPIPAELQSPKVSFHWLILYLKRVIRKINWGLNYKMIFVIIPFNEQIMDFMVLMEI